MKKVFIMVGVLFLGMSAARAQKQTGFAMSADLLLGYKDKNFTTTIGYDFGYKPLRCLYIGAGPLVGGVFGNGSSGFSVGGYGKLRFALPLKEDRVAPFVDVRGGYAYSLTNSSGDPIYGAGLGVRFARKYSVGIYCNINTYEVVTQESYISGYNRRKNPLTGKYQNFPVYSKRNVSNTKTNYTPSLLFSIDF